MSERTMVEALNLALEQEMERDDRVVVLGEDVGVDGGVFRVTEGLLDAYGEKRVMDTPLAESAIVAMSTGMAAYGLRPVCEIQFSGFSYLAMHQLESHAARLRWRSRGRYSVPLVARMPYGAGVRALEHHSESKEIYFAHTPGLKMVIPSGPRTARAARQRHPRRRPRRLLRAEAALPRLPRGGAGQRRDAAARPGRGRARRRRPDADQLRRHAAPHAQGRRGAG